MNSLVQSQGKNASSRTLSSASSIGTKWRAVKLLQSEKLERKTWDLAEGI